MRQSDPGRDAGRPAQTTGPRRAFGGGVTTRDQSGSIFRPVGLGYKAVLVKYADIGCDLPSGQTELTGITAA